MITFTRHTICIVNHMNLAFNTDDNENNGIYRHGEEPVLKNQKQFMVPPRCVVVFIGLRSIGHDAKIQE